mmetsp:Transcript_90925/g.245722  ORF Transcript_90925/g.245722 Transcript_90925/m.245722 type:complete len:354 (+) Transcript_90925:2181-3242(+)
MRRWRRCSARLTELGPSTCTLRSSVTPGETRSTGKFGEVSRCSMATRTRSETCYESGAAFRPCSPKCTSMPRISLRRQWKMSSTQCRLQRPNSSPTRSASVEAAPWAARPSVNVSQQMQARPARSSWVNSSLGRSSRVRAKGTSSSLASKAWAITRTRPSPIWRPAPGLRRRPSEGLQQRRCAQAGALLPDLWPRTQKRLNWTWTWTTRKRAVLRPRPLRHPRWRREQPETLRRSILTSRTSRSRVYLQRSSAWGCPKCARKWPHRPNLSRSRPLPRQRLKNRAGAKHFLRCRSSKRAARVRAREAAAAASSDPACSRSCRRTRTRMCAWQGRGLGRAVAVQVKEYPSSTSNH